MKLSKIILSAALLVAAFPTMAQEELTEYKFAPHWFLQTQIGGQETLGEGSFGKLTAPNAQLAAGYKFNPYIGARLAVNAWQSKAVMALDETNRWKWNYVAPTVDVLFDMTNILGGYNPNRLVDVNVFAGIGANIGFNNKEANNFAAAYKAEYDYQPLRLLWNGTKARFVAKFGADVNFNITEHFALGLELQANTLPDGYNSKKAGNADWYFNALVGARFTFGKKYTKTTRVVEPQIVERVVERVVEVPVQVTDTVYINETVKEEKPYRVDIFFTISNATISNKEMNKVTEMADYLKANPGKKVTITGYADKGTGTRAINLRLSKQRAQSVARVLKDKYGIAADRIIVESMGDDENQPYPDPVMNRVAICITD